MPRTSAVYAKVVEGFGAPPHPQIPSPMSALPSQGQGDAPVNVRKLRQAARRDVVVEAAATIEGQTLPITIANVSVGGVGFAGQTGLACGDDVVIHLPDGRSLSGRVAWSRSGSGGIAFDKALTRQDPLFGELPARVGAAGGGDEAGRGQKPAGRFGRILEAARQLLAGSKSSRASKAMSEKKIHRLCRKQGFAWLAGDGASRELGFRE